MRKWLMLVVLFGVLIACQSAFAAPGSDETPKHVQIKADFYKISSDCGCFKKKLAKVHCRDADILRGTASQVQPKDYKQRLTKVGAKLINSPIIVTTAGTRAEMYVTTHVSSQQNADNIASAKTVVRGLGVLPIVREDGSINLDVLVHLPGQSASGNQTAPLQIGFDLKHGESGLLYGRLQGSESMMLVVLTPSTVDPPVEK